MPKRLSQFIIVLLLCAGHSWGQGPSIITTSPLPNGALGADYYVPLAANGGMQPYIWSVLTGTLPNGLTLNTLGGIVGVPTTPGTSSFLVEVKDMMGLGDMRQFSLSIVNPANPFYITTTSPLPNGQLGVQYALTFAAMGAPQPYTWSLTSGVLPGGMTLSLTGGTLSGTPTTTGTWNFTVQVVGSGASANGPPTASQAFSLTIKPPPIMVTSPPTLAPSTAGLGYARTLQAAGGMPPYAWTLVSGTPPPGVTMNTGGMLSGTPTTAGLYSFTVQVVDSLATTFPVSASIQALINPAISILTTSPLPPGTVGVAYSLQGTGSGGTPPTTRSVVGALPPGLAFDPISGILSGTPTTAGNYSFALQAVDSVGATASRMFAIAINQSLAITVTSPLPGGTANVAYSQTLISTGGAAPLTWSVSSGSLPSGLTLTGAGVLSGTPAVATGSIFTVQVTDAVGATVTKQLVLNIAAPLAISVISLPGGNVGLNYTHTLIATGGRLPYAWSLLSGALPSGVVLASAGTLFGIPTAAGGFNFTIQVSDASQVTASSSLSIAVAPQLKITSPSALPGATMASPYNQALTASGGTPPYLWSIAGGALPAGLSLNASSGTINGVPGATGQFSFTAQVKDSAGIMASSFLSLAVSSRPAIGTLSTLPPGVTGTAYQLSLSGSGGTPPYQWTLQSGALPAGLTLDPSSGAIGGKASAPGHASFTVQLQDSAGISAAKAFDLTVTQTLSVAPATLLFRAPLAPQTIQVSCSTVGAPLSISTSAPWLVATPAHSASPAAISITADPNGLAAGSYRGTVSVVSSDVSQIVSVTLTVEASATPARPEASPATLTFAFALGATPSSQSVTVTGGATYTATVSNGAGWLSVSPPGGAALAVTANPATMAAGTYSGRILLDDGSTSASIVVNMSISAASQNLVLSQTGLTFYTVAGSTGSQLRSVGVLNSGQGNMNWTATSSTLSGGSGWLSTSPASGASGSTAQAASLVAQVNPTGLAAGEYYGQVAVAAPSAGNSPRLVSVVLNVLPADKSPGAQVYPSGLLFTGVAHGGNPDPKIVTLTNVGATAASYTSSNLTDDGASWITLTPASGSVPGSTSLNLAVQPNIASLGPGVWQGSITLRFGDGSVRAVNVALVLRSSQPAGSPKEHLAAGCTPSKLVPLFTSLGSSFSVPASWPSALEMAVVNDCGDPFTAGSVVTTFSNGDPPLALTALREGNWGGTWTPRGVSASGVLLTGQSRNVGGDLQGAARITGGVRSNPNPPVISPGGIVSSASFATDAPLAPGSIIAIFGSHLADGAITAQSLPLPSQLGQTQVIIGGQQMPLFFVSDGQINAMLPYAIAVNRLYQVVVQRGTSSTIPETITLAAAGPAVFTKDETGIGAGLVFDARFRPIDTTNQPSRETRS